MTKDDIKSFLDINVDEIVHSDEILLTIDQVATQLNVSSQTIRNWELQGKIPASLRTEGGHRRYKQSDINHLKKRQGDFEVLLKTRSNKILEAVQKIVANFNDQEEIVVSIRSDNLNRVIHFTFDSEDGLQTFTKTFKMED